MTTLTITLGAPWGVYSNTLPEGSEALGTVSRAPGDAGALIRTQAGQYAQLNAGAVRTLPQAEVAALVGKPKGRRPLPPGQAMSERFELRCTPAQRAKLESLGGQQWLRDRIDRAKV